MKFVLAFIVLVTVECILSAPSETPGFFIKVAKNVPRLGKRNNLLIKQGGKNVPRLGRRSGYNPVEEIRFFTHVQPFDSKFILDFLSDQLFIGDGDLKFISWNDFDKILESDADLKKKLTSIARDKEIDELKKLVYQTSGEDNEVYGRPISYQDSSSKKIYQKFVPYDAGNNFKYNNMENEVYYYQNNDVKRNQDAK